MWPRPAIPARLITSAMQISMAAGAFSSLAAARQAYGGSWSWVRGDFRGVHHGERGVERGSPIPATAAATTSRWPTKRCTGSTRTAR